MALNRETIPHEPQPMPRQVVCQAIEGEEDDKIVSAMTAYTKKYQPNRPECKECRDQCVNLISPKRHVGN